MVRSVITSDGATREWVGSSAEIQASIEHPDPAGTWIARIKLPPSWTASNYLEAGYMRSQNGLASLFLSPYPCVPWRVDPGRYRFNLMIWDPVPEAPPSDEP